MQDVLPILILNARPAAGKSEIIHFLENLDPQERLERFHLGALHVIDDFPMIWAWFEEDDLLEKVFQLPRLHSDPEGYFYHQEYWHLLIQRMGLEYSKWLRDSASGGTCIIEFSRGEEHGGYEEAFQYMSEDILRKAACLYINVSYEESLQKNRKRYNPERPDSILEHGLSDKKIRTLYRDDDWAAFSRGDEAYLHIRNFQVPYVVFENEDDVTTPGGVALETRLQGAMELLWRRFAVHDHGRS